VKDPVFKPAVTIIDLPDPAGRWKYCAMADAAAFTLVNRKIVASQR